MNLKPIILIIFIAMKTTSSNNAARAVCSEGTPSQSLAIATRLHLGYASHPPPTSQLHDTLQSFAELASAAGAQHAVVAVDSEPKLEGYDFVSEIRDICSRLNQDCENDSMDAPSAADAQHHDDDVVQSSIHTSRVSIHVLPVTPWGKFIPALNAIVAWSAHRGASCLLLASAEVVMTKRAMNILWKHMDFETTLVVGAALQGHTHRQVEPGSEIEVELNGRTTPWNTLALWNLPKLSLTGFLLVSEGLHPEEDGREGASGVEEVCTIATLQRILPQKTAQAKLVSIPPEKDGVGAVVWGQDFGDDEQRKEWHERKMRSKLERAKRQMDLMGLSGKVTHC